MSLFTARISASGVWMIRRKNHPGWVPHNNPDLLRWMGENGYSSVEEIPAEEDYRPPDTCERCGAKGVEVHHTAPKEWFGKEEAERWPMQNLCPTCHKTWHWAAGRAAAKLTVRILKGKELWGLAKKIEQALEVDA